MKDRQTLTAAAQPSIPVISPVLHWIALPTLLFLRSGFGYSFLRSRLIFLVSVWLSILFTIYAFYTQETRTRYWALALYCLAASLLYLAHLATCLAREARRTAKHDAFAGVSHLARIPGIGQFRYNEGFVTILQLWIEPFFILFVAATLRAMFSEQRLSWWLVIVALAMWFKALINYWYGIRSEKKRVDIVEDAEEKMPVGGGAPDVPLPNAGGRKPKAKRRPQAGTSTGAPELRYVEVLRLMPPFSLEQAEQNYRTLIKACHPDPNADIPENTARAAMLNEAIAHMRQKLGG